MSLIRESMDVLEQTSRTFFIPISRLPPRLLEAVAAAYLCMRSIDEIEDHPTLENTTKAWLLRTTSVNLQTLTSDWSSSEPTALFGKFVALLPEVTYRLGDWIQLAPMTIKPRVIDAISAMADRMAYWAETGWNIQSKSDLDTYTFGVAGAVGLLLSDLWAWYDNTQTNREYAIGFGRGLQSVNILRNREEDMNRGVNFFPLNWNEEQVTSYARFNLSLANAYLQELPPGPAFDFCKIPFDLANATLSAISRGDGKLSRAEVIRLTSSPVK